MNLLVNIDVPDLAAAEAFYTRAFGLTRARRLGTGVTELTGAAVPIYLLTKSAGSAPFSGATSPRTFERHWTPVHLDVLVSNLEAALERALGAGARAEGDIGVHAWGRIAELADPFGHGICLIELSERGYDALVEDGARG
jgi:catechol 2,3-dioxygenase-like lactoylglutathione lyase family enzyme